MSLFSSLFKSKQPESEELAPVTIPVTVNYSADKPMNIIMRDYIPDERQIKAFEEFAFEEDTYICEGEYIKRSGNCHYGKIKIIIEKGDHNRRRVFSWEVSDKQIPSEFLDDIMSTIKSYYANESRHNLVFRIVDGGYHAVDSRGLSYVVAVKKAISGLINYPSLNYENIGTYLKSNVSPNTCGHTATTINMDDFQEKGTLYDNSYGYLSYLNFRSENESDVFTGSYPLHDCQVLKCRKCDQIVFFHMNDGGIAPRPEFFLADYTKSYLPEPAVKAVHLLKARLDAFREAFGFPELEDRAAITRSETIGYTVRLQDKETPRLFNYREFKSGEEDLISFDLVATTDVLRKVQGWMIEGK